MSELRKVYTTVDARDRIVEAALTVFAQRGFDGATTREIAKEAGVSSALIHHHFKDKESLWKLVGERISEEFVEAITSSMNPDLRGTGDGARQMVAAYMHYWREHPRALRFQLWRVLGAPADERKARSKQAAQDAGHVRTDVPAGLLMVTMGGLIQYFLHSDVETGDALAVTGARPMTDEQALDYVWGLVAAVPPATTSAAKKRRTSTRTK
jgi:AcrR family transcriptional regulator